MTDPLTTSQAHACFEQAFGAAFTTDYAVTYQAQWGVWMAHCSVQGVPVAVHVHAPDGWRVSHQWRADSIPFRHTCCSVCLRHRLEQALQRLVAWDVARAAHRCDARFRPSVRHRSPLWDGGGVFEETPS